MKAEDILEVHMKNLKSLIAVALALLSLGSAVAQKGDYPVKPIQVIVTGKPGGDSDFHARTIARYMEKELRQPVVIVNMEGAGGSIGANKVKLSPLDGYTVLFFHTGIIFTEITGVTEFGFDAFEMGAVVTMDNGNVWCVNGSSPYKTLGDYVKAAKAKPGMLTYGTDLGGYTYFQGIRLEDVAGIDINIVDVGGAAAKNAALLGRQIDMAPNPYGSVKSFIESGDFRALAVLSETRHPSFPNVPTAKEQGFDIVMPKPHFFLFPKGTPRNIIDAFDAAAKRVVLTNSAYAADIEKAYYMKPYYSEPGAGVDYLSKEREKFLKFKK